MADDTDVLEKILQAETEAYEKDLKRVERERETYKKFKRIGSDVMRRFQKVEQDRLGFLERLHENDDSLKNLAKVIRNKLLVSSIQHKRMF